MLCSAGQVQSMSDYLGPWAHGEAVHCGRGRGGAGHKGLEWPCHSHSTKQTRRTETPACEGKPHFSKVSYRPGVSGAHVSLSARCPCVWRAGLSLTVHPSLPSKSFIPLKALAQICSDLTDFVLCVCHMYMSVGMWYVCDCTSMCAVCI